MTENVCSADGATSTPKIATSVEGHVGGSSVSEASSPAPPTAEGQAGCIAESQHL